MYTLCYKKRSVELFTITSSVVNQFLGSPTLVETALSFTAALSFFFCRDTAFSSRAEYGYQMCIGGSIVGEAPTICPERSTTPPLIFTGVKKWENWRHFQRRSNLRHRRLKMRQDISNVTVTVTEALVLRPPTRRPRAHHRVNPYPGARKQN